MTKTYCAASRDHLLRAALPCMLVLTAVGASATLFPDARISVRFVDVAKEWGITFRHENGTSAEKIMVETFGSGVAAFDYDNDGRIDLFFANGANLLTGAPSPGNALYRNARTGNFIDVTERAGVPVEREIGRAHV